MNLFAADVYSPTGLLEDIGVSATQERTDISTGTALFQKMILKDPHGTELSRKESRTLPAVLLFVSMKALFSNVFFFFSCIGTLGHKRISDLSDKKPFCFHHSLPFIASESRIPGDPVSFTKRSGRPPFYITERRPK